MTDIWLVIKFEAEAEAEKGRGGYQFTNGHWTDSDDYWHDVVQKESGYIKALINN